MKTLQVEHKEGYIIVQIDNGKVNAIDTLLAKELGEVFKEMEGDDKVQGLILTGRPHCFSAGLDIVTLSQGGAEGAKVFWRYYLGALQAMVRFSKPFVCAITGYAPAGGTILTLCADYRIMGQGPKHVIGMHEVKMNMQVPELLCDIYAYQLGEKAAWKAVQEARLFTSDEAKEIGLVDESVAVEDVLPQAEKRLQYLLKIYTPIYQKSKTYLRKGLLRLVDRDIEEMVETIAQEWDDPYVQETIKAFLASLKKKE